MPGGASTTSLAIANCDGFDTYATTTDLLDVRPSGALLVPGGGPYSTNAIKIDGLSAPPLLLGANDNTGGTISTATPVMGCVHFKIDAYSFSTFPVLSLMTPGGPIGAFIGTAGELILADTGGIVFTSATGVIALNTWYRVGVRVHASAPTFLTLTLDGSVITTGAYTAGASNVSSLRLSPLPGTATDFTWFDDPILATGNSVADQGLEHCRLVSAVPNGAGSLDNLAPGSGAAANYTYLDETPIDLDTTYLYAPSMTGSALYTVPTAGWSDALNVEQAFISAWANSTTTLLPLCNGDSGSPFTSVFAPGAFSGYTKWSRSLGVAANTLTEIGISGLASPAGFLTAVQVYVARSLASSGASLVVSSLFLPIAAGSPTVLAAGQLQVSGLAVPVAFGSPALTVDQAIFVPSHEVPVYMSPNLVVQPERIAPLGLFVPVALGAPVVYDANAAAAGGNSLVIRR